MKFDVVIMNPPYMTKSDESNTKTQAIWDKFVACAVDVVKEGGLISAIHPSGWRGGNGMFQDAKIIKNKQVEYLEIHDEADGLKTFGVTTRYDWYVLKNIPAERPTVIMDQDGEKCHATLADLPCIPNCMIEKVISMVAKGSEKPVEIIHSFSAYESRKNWINKEKSDKFKYPIVYSTPVGNPTVKPVEIICDSTYHTQRDHMSRDKSDIFKYEVVYSTPVGSPTIWYSSIQNGHFGIPKIIFNPCRPIGFVIDDKGEYGMSQFCVGIVGSKKYLDMVANVLTNQKTNGFSEFMESCHFTDKIFNKDIVSKFRADFWKEFV